MRTHSRPAMKTTSNPSFFCSGILNLAMMIRGGTSMIVSVILAMVLSTNFMYGMEGPTTNCRIYNDRPYSLNPHPHGLLSLSFVMHAKTRKARKVVIRTRCIRLRVLLPCVFTLQICRVNCWTWYGRHPVH